MSTQTGTTLSMRRGQLPNCITPTVGSSARAWAAASVSLPPAVLVQSKMQKQTQRALDQDLLFMIRDGDDNLDRQLAAKGYKIIDPVVIYAKALKTPRPERSEESLPTQNIRKNLA